MQRKINNENKLANIPVENLFVSESGYAYDINEIADFIQGGSTFNQYAHAEEKFVGLAFLRARRALFHPHQDENKPKPAPASNNKSEEVKGTFRDFKNKELAIKSIEGIIEEGERRDDPPMNLFSLNDIEALSHYPIIVKAFESTKNFTEIQGCAFCLGETTIDEIGKVAEIAQLMANLSINADEAKVSLLLTRHLTDFHVYATKLNNRDKMLLTNLTRSEGARGSYAIGRANNFLEDIEEAIKHPKCMANFYLKIRNLYLCLKSHSLFLKFNSVKEDILDENYNSDEDYSSGEEDGDNVEHLAEQETKGVPATQKSLTTPFSPYTLHSCKLTTFANDSFSKADLVQEEETRVRRTRRQRYQPRLITLPKSFNYGSGSGGCPIS